jgi:hypothetical protein
MVMTLDENVDLYGALAIRSQGINVTTTMEIKSKRYYIFGEYNQEWLVHNSPLKS